VLLCAPSLGVLDNWLPVLHAARSSHPDWRIVALVPNRQTLGQLDSSDTAHVLADEVIDATIAPLHDGAWTIVNGFLGAAKSTKRRLLSPWFLARYRRTKGIALSGLNLPTNRLLYDIHLHEKSGLVSILGTLNRVPRFSYNHGLILEQPGERRVPLPSDGPDVTVFAFSSEEIAPYSENFFIQPSRVRVAGIPRHAPEWVDFVTDRSHELHSIPFAEFLFVISRPAGSTYLPWERKVQSLRDLYEVSWKENGLPLLIRAHPKESLDGTLREALPLAEEGTAWALTRAHPFQIASRSRLAVAFFSGVVIDMVALGVPAVEFLDVSGLPDHDGTGSLRDARGRPTFGPYRRDGLVIPAHDADDLRAAFRRLSTHRESIVTEQQAALKTRFASIEDGARQMLISILR
jgi:hypothetical protein